MSPRDAVFGALVTPVTFTGYLLMVGDPLLPGPLGRYHASTMLWVFYLAPLAALGATVGGTHKHLPVTASLAGFVLLGLPFISPSAPDGSLFAVNFPALFALVVVLLVAGGEWAMRHPVSARELFTRQTVRVGLVVGVSHAVVAHLLRTGVFGIELAGPSLFSLGIAVWMVGGAVIAGATPGFLFARFRLWSPAVVVAGLFAWTAWDTWRYLVDLRASGAVWGVAFTPFTGYLVAWFVVVALAIAAGWTEQQTRRVSR